MSAVTCAAPGCDNPVPRRPGRVGRPPIYCSPQCRPSHTRSVLTVEVDQCGDGELQARDWEVRLRRGERRVVLQRGLGRFTASALASDIEGLLTGGASP